MNAICYYTQAVYNQLVRRMSNPIELPLASQSLATVQEGRHGDIGDSWNEIDVEPMEEEEHVVYTIENLPVEILDLVFNQLDISTLKKCRLVCHHWNTLLSNKSLFLQNLCLCHVESSTQSDAKGTELVAYFEQTGGKRPLDLSALRIRHLYSFWNQFHPSFFHWMNASHMSRVTWLEIVSSQIKLSQFLEILAELVNLESLRISGDTIIHDSGQIDMVVNPAHIRGQIQLCSLKHVWLHFEDLHAFLVTLDRLNLLLFQNLVTLDLQGDAGNPTNIFRIGDILGKLLRQNSKSLKIFKFDNFPGRVYGALEAKLSSSKLRASLYAEFPRFSASFPWNDLDPLPNLEEISFQRFPVAPMSLSFLQQNLALLFSKTGKNLRKFSISTLYLSNDVVFEKLMGVVPKHVTLSATSLHLHAPNPNLDEIAEVMHCEQNILKYQQAMVDLQFEKVNWTILYLTWSSLRNPAMHKWAGHLVALRLTGALFQIGDDELQFLIEEAQNLEELTFDACDLGTLTDSGLTGLSPVAVNKIWTNNKYQPIPEDFTGQPIQSLKKLHSIKLSDVGREVSKVAILYSFLKMPQLQFLTIHQDELTIGPSVINELRAQRNLRRVEIQMPIQIY